MENKEFNISKPVSAFIALVVAFLVIGYYVVNLIDIETEGTTAEEALLPQVFSSTDGNLVVRYPAEWSFQEVQGQYIFTPDDTDDPKPEIRFQVFDQPIDAVVATINPASIEGGIRDFTTEDGTQTGNQFTMAADSETSGPRSIDDITLLPAPNDRTLVAILTATETNIHSYRETYELMINSAVVQPLEVVELPSRAEGEPLALEQAAYSELFDVTVPYPNDWEAQDLSSGGNFFLMNPVGDTFTQIGFILLPLETPTSPQETLESVFANFPASVIVEGITPTEFGEFQGLAFVTIDRVGDPTQGLPPNYQEIGVVSWIDGQQMIYIVLDTELDAFTDLRASVAEIISGIERGNTLAPPDDTSSEDTDTSDADSGTDQNSADTDSATDESSAEEDTTDEASDTDEATDQSTDSSEDTESTEQGTESESSSE